MNILYEKKYVQNLCTNVSVEIVIEHIIDLLLFNKYKFILSVNHEINFSQMHDNLFEVRHDKFIKTTAKR